MTKKQETVKTVPTEYPCPCCKKPLHYQYGNQMYPGDEDYGAMLFCIHGDPHARTHPQEVAGHGNGRSLESMLKVAYAVIQAKFCGARLETEGELQEVDVSEVETETVPEAPKKGKRKVKTLVPVVADDEEAI
jgi:hypothetical protein